MRNNSGLPLSDARCCASDQIDKWGQWLYVRPNGYAFLTGKDLGVGAFYGNSNRENKDQAQRLPATKLHINATTWTNNRMEMAILSRRRSFKVDTMVDASPNTL